MSKKSVSATLNQLTLFVVDSPARTCQLPENGRALLESGVDCGGSLRELLTNLSHDGLLSKMSPDFYPAVEGQTLPPSFDGWSSGGMAWPGGYLTLNTSGYPSDGDACSLSDILETDVLPKYYLSAKACQGILRRARVRERELPKQLQEALQEIAGETATE